MDPITFALLLGAALWVTDTASGGLVRAELGGGLSGAARGAGRRWVDRRVRTHRRRQKARAKSKFGRVVNYGQDEIKAYTSGIWEGWPEGRRRAHTKRRERWERKPPWWKRVFGPSDPSEEPEPDPETPFVPTPKTPKGEPKTIPVADPEGPTTTPEASPGQPKPTIPNAAPNGANPRGTATVSDLTTAPAVIAAWEELHGHFEEIEAQVDDLATEAAQLRDGAGDFATGTEGDGAGAVQDALEKLQAAREAVQSVIDALHDEWDAHIAAAEGGQAGAHQPFQEV